MKKSLVVALMATLISTTALAVPPPTGGAKPAAGKKRAKKKAPAPDVDPCEAAIQNKAVKNALAKDDYLSREAKIMQMTAARKCSSFDELIAAAGLPSRRAPDPTPPPRGWCGDGRVDSDEECDQGEKLNGAKDSLCDSKCRAVKAPEPVKPTCGNSIVEAPEECDNGSANGKPGNVCDSSCHFVKAPEPKCGDSKVDTGEQCDLGDKNGTEGALCDDKCKTVTPPAASFDPLWVGASFMNGLVSHDNLKNGNFRGGIGTIGYAPIEELQLRLNFGYVRTGGIDVNAKDPSPNFNKGDGFISGGLRLAWNLGSFKLGIQAELVALPKVGFLSGVVAGYCFNPSICAMTAVGPGYWKSESPTGNIQVGNVLVPSSLRVGGLVPVTFRVGLEFGFFGGKAQAKPTTEPVTAPKVETKPEAEKPKAEPPKAPEPTKKK